MKMNGNAASPQAMNSKGLLASLIVMAITQLVNGQSTGYRDTTTIKQETLLAMPFEDLMNVRVVTPTMSFQKSAKAPATVMVVTMEQIRLRGYRNLAEILNDLPDFTIQDKSDPQFYNAVSARGVFRQDHFVILMDGVRISSPTNEPLPILENFPIYLAKQIEVVYGPGSALYGADAMAGVINIITQKPGDGKTFNATAIGGSQGYANTNILFNKKLRKGLNFSMAGQYSYDAQPDFSKVYKNDFGMTAQQTGAFNTSYGLMTPQGPINKNYEAPIGAYNFYTSIDKDGFSLRLLHHYVEVPSSTTLKPENGVYNKDVFYGQGVTTASANYITTQGMFKSTSTIVGSFYKVNPLSNYRNLYDGMEHGYKYSTGTMMKLEEQITFTASKRLIFTGGLTYELFQSVPKTPELQRPVSSFGAASGILLNSAAPNNPFGIDAKFFTLLYSNVGTYLQGQYRPIDRLSLTAGVRVDRNSRFGSTVNPRVGAVYTPFENTTIKVLYGTAFWAPSPMVSFESYGSFYSVDNGSSYQSGYWHLPNPNLKPMISQTAELSISQKVNKKLRTTLTLYRSNIDNMINNVSDNGNTNLYNNKFLGWNVDFVEVPFNEGTQENYGGNLLVNGTFNVGTAKFNAWSSVCYTEGKVSIEESGGTKKVEQPTITPWQFRVGLEGKLNAFYFSTRLINVGDQRMTGFVDNNNPYKRKTICGYTLLNISAGYALTNKTTFFITAENALDQRYRCSVAWDASDANAETFNGSFQNPLRIMTGLRVSF